MGRFFNAVKAGVAGMREGTEPGEYTIAGKTVKCPHCGHQKFTPGHAMLNSKGRELFGVAWADPSAATLICSDCSRIEWFAQEPDRVES